jgi:hypothetical protein
MVPPEMMKLHELVNHLQGLAPDIHSYPASVGDALFDLFTVDTFVAGIADRLLSGMSVQVASHTVLRTPIPVTNSYWVSDDGREIDLREYPEILAFVQVLEELRQECWAIVSASN